MGVIWRREEVSEGSEGGWIWIGIGMEGLLRIKKMATRVIVINNCPIVDSNAHFMRETTGLEWMDEETVSVETDWEFELLDGHEEEEEICIWMGLGRFEDLWRFMEKDESFRRGGGGVLDDILNMAASRGPKGLLIWGLIRSKRKEGRSEWEWDDGII